MNADKLKNFPNQTTQGDMFECVALSVTDIAGNIDGRLFSPDFTYAATIFLEGTIPGVDPQGVDPWTAFQSAVAYGLLPKEDATFNATTTNELYASAWSHFPQNQRTIALQHQKAAGKNIGVNYYDMVSFMRATGYGVALPLTWFSSFMEAPGGVLPQFPTGVTSNHCVAAYLDDDGATVLIKPWLGSDYGKNGYAILTKQMFDTIVKDVYSFDPNGNHWLALLGILITKYPYLIDRYQQLSQAPFPPKVYLPITTVYPMTPTVAPNIEHTDTMYPDWDTQSHAFHNTRVLCDLMNLSLQDKNDLCACVWVESNFLKGAIGKPNSNGTQDFGIAQFNNGTIRGTPLWIGPGAAFASTDEVLNNPHKGILIMIQTWQAGHRNWWSSHSTGAYLPFRDPASYTGKFVS